ncbi:MAG: hypothetical protein DRJ44_00425 [Thermoprotei archaeon]|nr:hypothetical protein [Thermoproteales archaeon]RLE75864.1 MAG: hypothetical protein DRZ80_02080 [Thermoprotei archaeon]RLE78164.1 MAG: hypothetical protein DRJ44_00425 [Thermoprotei archaeon]
MSELVRRLMLERKLRNNKGSQLVEEGLLLGLSLIAMIILLSLLSNIIATLKVTYQSSEGALDKFLIEILGDDLDALYNATLGQITNGG